MLRLKPKFTKRGIQLGLHNPFLALRLLVGRSTYEEALREQMAQDLNLLVHRASDTFRSEHFLQQSQEALEEWLGSVAPAKSQSSWRMLGRWHSFLYSATRAVTPSTVVETGVLYGHSSAAILAALNQNRKGLLISIDLPPEQHRSVIAGRRHIQVGLSSNQLSVGCAIPSFLRSNWKLQLGNSLEFLPEIFDETGPVSMFIHDSLHTYDHMMAEFQLGYHALEPGGLLVSDDIGYNSAWSDFCHSKKEDWTALSKEPNTKDQFGFLIKSHDSK
jgi:hypothetical protein